jgi:hypothetical protein
MKPIKITLSFWFLTCFLGSIVVVEIERYLLNYKGVFDISLSEGIFYIAILTILSLVVSLPALLTIYFLFQKGYNRGGVISYIGFSFFILVFFTIFYLTNNLIEALYFTCPYFILAAIFELLYLKFNAKKKIF